MNFRTRSPLVLDSAKTQRIQIGKLNPEQRNEKEEGNWEGKKIKRGVGKREQFGEIERKRET